MQQILVLSIKEFYRMAADVADEISKLEEQNENHNVIIEKVGDDIRISITETPDMDKMIALQRGKVHLTEYQEREKKYARQPATRECPHCGSVIRKTVDRRYNDPVRYWCRQCEKWWIFPFVE